MDKNFDSNSENPLSFTASVDGQKIETKVQKIGFDLVKKGDCGVDVSITHYWYQVFGPKQRLVIEHSAIEEWKRNRRLRRRSNGSGP